MAALPDFLSPVMGKTIVERQKRISDELSSGVKIVLGGARKIGPGESFSSAYPLKKKNNEED